MQIKKLFSKERLERLLVSLLLFSGLYLPMVFTFSAESAMLSGLLCGIGIILLFWAENSLFQSKLVLPATAVVLAAVQFFLPEKGIIGSCITAIKAISLFINGAEIAVPVFAGAVAICFGVVCALIAYLFSHPSAGFLPATICVVLMYYAMWNFSANSSLWYSAPALLALLLLVSQTSHRRSNMTEVLPVSAVVVILSLLILPVGQTVITPLYNAAMELKQTIEDYLFFTDARDVFSIGNYGWYPMGNGQLGGAVEISEQPVLMVKSDEKVLLRCITKDEYTGRTWQDTEGGKRYLYVNPRWSRLRQSVFLEDLPSLNARDLSDLLNEKAINVQVQNTAASTLPVPAFLRSFTSDGNLVAYFNDSAELFTTRDLQRDDRYTAFAPIFEGGGSELGTLINTISSNSADADYSDICARYTALPAHLESKVYEDAQKMVAGYDNPYDQACAIYRNLRKYYKYTLTPDTPPENQDFVTYFLYIGKEGYSTYFASAMAVLCRMNGIPARYVEGFACIPSADGFCYVTEKNAKAWVEVYFSGFGWVPFDPTPAEEEKQDSPKNDPEPTPTPTPPPEEPEITPTPPPSDDSQQDEPENEEPPENNNSFSWWIWLLAAVLLAAIIVRAYMTSPTVVEKRQNNVQDQVYVYGSACMQLLKNRGITAKQSETPMRFAQRVDALPQNKVGITRLWKMLSVSSYSRMSVNEKGAEYAKGVYTEMWKKESVWKKLLFRIQCMLSNQPYHALDTQLVSQKETLRYPSVGFRSPKGKKTGKNEKMPSSYRPPLDYVAPKVHTAEEIEAELHQEKHDQSEAEQMTSTVASTGRRRRG